MTSENYTFPSVRYIFKANVESLTAKINWFTCGNIHPPPSPTITKYTDRKKHRQKKTHSRLIHSGWGPQLKRMVRVNNVLRKHFVKKVMKIERRVLEGEKLFSEHLRIVVEKESELIIYSLYVNSKKHNNTTELDCKHYAEETHSTCPTSCHECFLDWCFNPIMDTLVSFAQWNSLIIDP